MHVENIQGETNPTNVDPFTFIDVWFFDLMLLKACKSGHNRSLIHFHEVVAKF